MSGNREAIAKLSMHDLEEISLRRSLGSVDEFKAETKEWMESAKDPRWNRLYTELTYLPMQEVFELPRANGYRTYIVTGGCVRRPYAEQTYGIPPEQVVGSAAIRLRQIGKPFLTKEAKSLLNDNDAGTEGIHR